jgi:SAM-dependent methyltransferase
MELEAVQSTLCVEETLGSGRRVVFGYRWDGAPTRCWDVALLPDQWLADPAWHPARLAAGHSGPDGALNALPILHSAPEALLDSWLARTYTYLEPLLGRCGCVLGSGHLFHEEVTSRLAFLASDAWVLEVGGNVAAQTLCRRLGCRGVAVDPAFSQTDASVKTVQCLNGTAASLPLPDNSVDAAISLFVLEHLVNPRAAVQEVLRVLKVGGLFLFGIPVTESEGGAPPLFHRWQFHAGESSPGGPGRQSLSINALIPNGWSEDSHATDKVSAIARESDAYLFEIGKTPHA